MAHNNYSVNLIDLKRVTGERKRKGAILTDWQRFGRRGVWYSITAKRREKVGLPAYKNFPNFWRSFLANFHI